MIKFLREHPEEYRLSRVDEAWYKGLLFQSFGIKRDRDLPHVINKPVAPGAEAWLDAG
jgi:hypothetical protein